MFKNYFITAIRSLHKNKLFAIVNILGLSLSMCVCLVALLQIKDAFTYDNFHPFPKRSFRVITDITGENGIRDRWATSPPPLADRLSSLYPFVEKTVHVTPAMDEELQVEQKKIQLKISYTEPAFFDIFGFNLAVGSKRDALAQPNSIVLTSKAAELFFPGENPLGKNLSIKNASGNYVITGILKDSQEKTHLITDAFVSFSSLEFNNHSENLADEWKKYSHSSTYVLLRENAPVASLEKALSTISLQNAALFQLKNISRLTYDYQRLDRISPGEDLILGGNYKSANSLWIISGITFLILLMACFNYTNLSLARSLSRAREVGVRKAMGGSKRQLFYQFVTESVTVSLLALTFACWLLLVLMKLPAMHERQLNGIRLDLSAVCWFVIFAVLTGILAGALPAAVLSSFRPVQVLKNLSSVRIFKGLALRKTLVVLQFGISLIFIVFLVTVNKQISFTMSYAYGFKEKDIINIQLPDSKGHLLKHELEKVAGVERISSSSDIFGFHSSDYAPMKKNLEDKNGIGTDRYFVDASFIPNMDLTIVAGTNFSSNDQPSLKNVVLNETAVKNLGYPHPGQVIGQPVWLNDSTTVTVVGVVKDFHYHNLKHAMGNLALCYDTARYSYLNVEAHGLDKASIISSLQTAWKKIYPAKPFTFSWYDEQLAVNRNKKEDVAMISFLALMAVTIACLGLLAMVTYTAEIRQKEVSIRKVLGAQVMTIIMLLSKNFIWLLILACAISLPIGYIVSTLFLQGFAYRITVGLQVLSTSVFFILAIGLFTIISQTIRVAIKNPVKNLRTD